MNEVVTAVHALEQANGIADVVGADLGLNDKTVGANVG